MTSAAARIDVHQHLIPPFYRDLLAQEGIAEAGGRPLPEWSPTAALNLMDLLGTTTAILSVSTPGTGFLPNPAEAAKLARRLNDFAASVVADHTGRFGQFATLPMPDAGACAAEARRALDELGADGVVLLANSRGTYLGGDGQDELWRVLDERRAVVLVHPAALPAPAVEGIPPFAADFLLEDFRSFYYDTALSSSPAALPSLMTFTHPGHVLFGSDWPFAPTPAGQYFATGLDTTLEPGVLTAINRTNAQALFPRLATAPAQPPAEPAIARVRHAAQRTAARLVFKLVQP